MDEDRIKLLRKHIENNRQYGHVVWLYPEELEYLLHNYQRATDGSNWQNLNTHSGGSLTNYQVLLAQSGLSKAELGRRLGVSAETVSRWCNDPPQYAIAYLRLYVAVKQAID